MGTSIRDSLKFISYNDYINQVEFSNISDEINNKVKKLVVKDFKVKNIVGKIVSFYGCFTIDAKHGKKITYKEIIITPVKLEILKKGA